MDRQREKKDQEKETAFAREEQEGPAEGGQGHVPPPEREDAAAREASASGLRPRDAGEAPGPSAAPAPRPPPRPRKHYCFTEATENLHHGLPAAGAAAGLPHRAGRRRPADAGPAPAPAPPAAAYEPSFAKASGPRADETAFRERKSSLMEELFGSGCVFSSGRASPAAAGGAADAPKSQTPHPLPPSPAAASRASGDSKGTVGNSAPTSSSTEGRLKMII